MRGISRKFILRLLCIFVILNACLDFYFYQNYQEKIDIVARVIQSEQESKLDVATEILKSPHVDTGQGKNILNQYGYLENGSNVYFREFTKECFICAGVSVVLFLVCCMLVMKQKRMYEKQENEFISRLEKCLILFREGNERVHISDEENMIRISRQLEALNDYLNRIKEQAKLEKEETKSLVTDISHQLKTPVAALDTCFTVLLNSDLKEDEKEEFSLRCRNSLDGLEVLLQSLLQISRLESGMIKFQFQKASLYETMVEAVNRIYTKASEKEIEIVVEVPEELEAVQVNQDKKWLAEAIINILDNAIKYSGAKSEIKICLYRRTSFLRIEIIDQGIGIPKEEYHKIFQRFYRGSQKQVKKENGSGVGLYLTRDIIQKHHGTVSVTSSFDRSKYKNPGSKFIIQLPMPN